MLLFFRVIAIVIFSIFVCTLGCVYCLYSPHNPKHVAVFGRLFSCLAPLLGIKVEKRVLKSIEHHGNAIYIANHQNNYDMFTVSGMVQPYTVTVGKKNLLWIPFFGQLYWLTGNLLIDRNKSAKAHRTISVMVDQLKKKKISFLVFPEGTRSRGRGLMNFKTGAFHAAIIAGVPIIPICVSNTCGKIKLNRWNNGWVIIDILPPVDTVNYDRKQVHVLAQHCRSLMEVKLRQINQEVKLKEVVR